MYIQRGVKRKSCTSINLYVFGSENDIVTIFFTFCGCLHGYMPGTVCS